MSKPRYEQIYNLYGVKVTGDDVVNAPVFTYGKAETNNRIVFNTPKNNYFPIPANEVKRAPMLGQNPGWDIAGDNKKDDAAGDEGTGDASGDNNSDTQE